MKTKFKALIKKIFKVAIFFIVCYFVSVISMLLLINPKNIRIADNFIFVIDKNNTQCFARKQNLTKDDKFCKAISDEEFKKINGDRNELSKTWN